MQGFILIDGLILIDNFYVVTLHHKCASLHVCANCGKSNMPLNCTHRRWFLEGWCWRLAVSGVCCRIYQINSLGQFSREQLCAYKGSDENLPFAWGIDRKQGQEKGDIDMLPLQPGDLGHVTSSQ